MLSTLKNSNNVDELDTTEHKSVNIINVCDVRRELLHDLVKKSDMLSK